ncbi:MAG TPA: DUF4058 family protein [Gemmataceae bacterium]|nr:DUF4058 family protein [Gemmataceae bacterium]
MPLRDHFHSPWKDENFWEGFHSAWANTIVRYLNGSVLSRRYRALPQVHLGAWVEADVATFERDTSQGAVPVAEGDSGEGTATAVWTPPEPVQTLAVDFPNQDVFEVRVLDEGRDMRLVAVVELVSPANKDWAEHRRGFVSKCAAYLLQQIGVVLVDIVTERRANLHRELLELLALKPATVEVPDLYAVAYRTHKENGQWHLDNWPYALAVGSPLPTLPLWLASDFSVPVDLEWIYEETCQVLRIE